MFDNISNKLNSAFRKLAGKGKISEKNIQEGIKEVRLGLLEADVNYKVVKKFINNVTERAVGKEVIRNVRPDQQFIKIVNDELVNLMGPVDHTIEFNPKRPTIFMMIGLQGSGKTTSCAKLANYLTKKGHAPLLVAADVQRPAAIEQLKVLGKELNIPVYAEDKGKPPKICRRSIDFAEKNIRDCIILDTAGRLHIDEILMGELKDIGKKTSPDYIFLVADAMTGQDAVNSASEFNKILDINGIILTKLDGDARGGAAMSIKAVTGKPIKFVGIGEKITNFEEFHPDRMASRILGMGDVVTLVEKAQEAIDVEEAEKLQRKIKKKELDLQDFLDSFKQMRKIGSFKDILSMIPGFGALGDSANMPDESEFKKMEAIILSMTFEERRHPEIINQSRKNRIARGCGSTVGKVNALLKQFKTTKKMMKKMSSVGKMKRMLGKFGIEDLDLPM